MSLRAQRSNLLTLTWGLLRHPATAGLLAMTKIVFIVVPVVVFGQSLDEPFGRQESIGELANAIFRFGIILIVLAAAIFIAIGAYLYLVASGNAESAKTGKEYISRAIIGLVLGLLAWVILNTISPQFTELK